MAPRLNPTGSSMRLLAGSYYITLDRLNTIVEASDHSTNTQQAEPVAAGFSIATLLTAPYIATGILFAASLAILTGCKFRQAKLNAAGLMLALFAAVIPAALSVINNGIGSFTNAGPSEVPRNIRIEHRDRTSVIVSWNTISEQPGLLRYSYSDNGTVRSEMAGSIRLRTASHSVLMTDLSPGTRYEVEIFSGSHWYIGDSGPLTFTFRSDPP